MLNNQSKVDILKTLQFKNNYLNKSVSTIVVDENENENENKFLKGLLNLSKIYDNKNNKVDDRNHTHKRNFNVFDKFKKDQNEKKEEYEIYNSYIYKRPEAKKINIKIQELTDINNKELFPELIHTRRTQGTAMDAQSKKHSFLDCASMALEPESLLTGCTQRDSLITSSDTSDIRQLAHLTVGEDEHEPRKHHSNVNMRGVCEISFHSDVINSENKWNNNIISKIKENKIIKEETNNKINSNNIKIKNDKINNEIEIKNDKINNEIDVMCNKINNIDDEYILIKKKKKKKIVKD